MEDYVRLYLGNPKRHETINFQAHLSPHPAKRQAKHNRDLLMAPGLESKLVYGEFKRWVPRITRLIILVHYCVYSKSSVVHMNCVCPTHFIYCVSPIRIEILKYNIHSNELCIIRSILIKMEKRWPRTEINQYVGNLSIFILYHCVPPSPSHTLNKLSFLLFTQKKGEVKINYLRLGDILLFYWGPSKRNEKRIWK